MIPPRRRSISRNSAEADIRAALEARLTYRQLVQMYLDRIAAYDKKRPALNAIIMINPNALPAADALDAKFARSRFAGPCTVCR
jgi:amidase